MAGFISKGIELSYSTSSSSSFTKVEGVIEIPDLGGDSDNIEVTTLSDAAHMYIPGILDYGDSLDFTLLHSKTQFAALAAMKDTTYYWKVTVPDGESGAAGTTCTFQGKCTIKLNSTTFNEALEDTLSIKPESEMTWA